MKAVSVGALKNSPLHIEIVHRMLRDEKQESNRALAEQIFYLLGATAYLLLWPKVK